MYLLQKVQYRILLNKNERPSSYSLPNLCLLTEPVLTKKGRISRLVCSKNDSGRIVIATAVSGQALV